MKFGENLRVNLMVFADRLEAGIRDRAKSRLLDLSLSN